MAPKRWLRHEGNVIKYFDLTPFADRFQKGSNYFGVMLQNGWAADWDNVAFDVALKSLPNVAPEVPEFLSIKREADGTITLVIKTAPSYWWRLESSDDAQNWSLVAQIMFSSSPGTFKDTGQGDRAHPSTVGHRYYRLREL